MGIFGAKYGPDFSQKNIIKKDIENKLLQSFNINAVRDKSATVGRA